jgi:hypothetical protein
MLSPPRRALALVRAALVAPGSIGLRLGGLAVALLPLPARRALSRLQVPALVLRLLRTLRDLAVLCLVSGALLCAWGFVASATGGMYGYVS